MLKKVKNAYFLFSLFPCLSFLLAWPSLFLTRQVDIILSSPSFAAERCPHPQIDVQLIILFILITLSSPYLNMEYFNEPIANFPTSSLLAFYLLPAFASAIPSCTHYPLDRNQPGRFLFFFFALRITSKSSSENARQTGIEYRMFPALQRRWPLAWFHIPHPCLKLLTGLKLCVWLWWKCAQPTLPQSSLVSFKQPPSFPWCSIATIHRPGQDIS